MGYPMASSWALVAVSGLKGSCDLCPMAKAGGDDRTKTAPNDAAKDNAVIFIRNEKLVINAPFKSSISLSNSRSRLLISFSTN